MSWSILLQTDKYVIQKLCDDTTPEDFSEVEKEVNYPSNINLVSAKCEDDSDVSNITFYPARLTSDCPISSNILITFKNNNTSAKRCIQINKGGAINEYDCS